MRGKFRRALGLFPEEKGANPTTFNGKEIEIEKCYMQSRWFQSNCNRKTFFNNQNPLEKRKNSLRMKFSLLRDELKQLAHGKPGSEDQWSRRWCSDEHSCLPKDQWGILKSFKLHCIPSVTQNVQAVITNTKQLFE